MDIYLRIDINLVAAALLGGVLFIAHARLDSKNSLNQSYLRIGMVVLLQLLVEASTCIINGRTELGLIPISYFLHFGLFFIAPFLSFYGFFLISNVITPHKILSGRAKLLLSIPVCISSVLTLLSLKYHFVFYISKDNVYHRGTYFLVVSVITYSYLVLTLCYAVVNRKQSMKHERIPLLLFSLFPIVGGIIQSIFYGPLLMWSSTAFSLVIIYVFLQERMVHLDDLTGAWTKGSFEYYMNNRLKWKGKEKIGIIYCDIDDFKIINDRYGHIEGDKAIKNTTKIIHTAIRKTDIIARVGGDEFILILERQTMEGIEETLNRIKQAFVHYNKISNKEYNLECSFGAGILELEDCSLEQFLHQVDRLMYENKRSKKAATK